MKLELKTESTTPCNYFQTAFPGFLIQAHKVISWDDLESASSDTEIARLTKNGCDYQCNNLLGKLLKYEAQQKLNRLLWHVL